MSMMRIKDEKEYRDLMAKRTGWPRGSVMNAPRALGIAQSESGSEGARRRGEQSTPAGSVYPVRDDTRKAPQRTPTPTEANGREMGIATHLPASGPSGDGCFPIPDTPQAAARTATSFEGLKRASSRAQSSSTAPGVLRRSRAAILPKSPKSDMPKRSELEVELQRQIESSNLPSPKYDVPYLVGSRHRLDVCWEEIKFGCEVNGNPHRIADKFHRDIEKRVRAQIQGWLIVEVDGQSIKNGNAIAWIIQLMSLRSERG